jgi:hypothetical protein
MGEGTPEMWAALTTTLAGPFFQEWPHPKALPYTKNLTYFFLYIFSLQFWIFSFAEKYVRGLCPNM